MLLNFLIAIFSETYTILSERKIGLYVIEIINIRKQYDYHPFCSSIVYSPIIFNYLFFPLTCLTICLKSKKFNDFVLKLEYIPIAIFGIIMFFVSVVIFIPFSYLIVSAMKIKFICEGRVRHAKERYLRVADALIFLLFGLIILMVVGVIDNIKFVMKLFDRDIQRVNQVHMREDGSLGDKDASANIRKDTNIQNKFVNKDQKKLSTTFTRSKGSDLGKGISDMSIKLLKVSLSILLKVYLGVIYRNKGRIPKHCYMLSKDVIKFIRFALCVQEQLNYLLIGAMYTKRNEYFNTKGYHCILNEIQHYYIDTMEGYFEDSIIINHPFDYLHKANTKENRDYMRQARKEWDMKLKEFLFQNEESWLLHQYSLIKNFVLQNSIDKDSSEISPLYTDFEAPLESLNADENNSSAKVDIVSHFLEPLKNKGTVKVIDVHAFFKTIRDIEKRIELKIVIDRYKSFNQVVKVENVDSEENLEENTFKYNRDQLSMISFSRNIEALKSMQ